MFSDAVFAIAPFRVSETCCSFLVLPEPFNDIVVVVDGLPT